MKRLFLNILLMAFLCFGCHKKEAVNLDYEIFENRFIQWGELFNQKEDTYYAYVFSYACGYCQDIKEDVLSFAYRKENFYFVVYSKEIPIIDSSISIIGEKDISKIGVVGTPTLLEIQDDKIKECFAGSKQIYKHLINNT